MTSKRKLRQSLAVIMAFVLVATLFIPYAAFADEFQLKGSNQGALSSAVVGGEKESDLSAATNNDDVGDVDEQNHSAEPSTSQSVVEEDRAAKDSSSHTESTTTQEQELAEVELLSDEAYEVGSEGDLAAALAAILDGTAENKPVKLTQGFAVTQSIVVHNTLEDAAHVLIMADQPVTLTANAGVRHFDIQGGSHDFSLLFHNIVLDGGNVGGGLYVGASDAAPVFINGLSEGQADPYGGIYTYELTLKNCSAHDGGSLFLENSNVSMFNTTILNSKATAKGGGIYCDAASHMNLSNIVVSNSSAAQGGGLYVASLANPDA
ncbi:MAG: hypothetical protein RR547_06350, partial [Raoultibacter sp.]